MHAVYELWLWIMQLILLRNPDFHHGLLALDSNGAAYVTGETQSIDFPVTQSAFQAGNWDPVVLERIFRL